MARQVRTIEEKRKELERKLRDTRPGSPEEQKIREQLQTLESRRKEFCPYRGLFAFREEDAEFFFGREAYTEKLVEAVQSKPFVAVVGASGSGKSSVVYAGLIPQLRRRGQWLTASFRPGHHPFRALSSALIPFLEPDLREVDRLVEVKKMSRNLKAGRLALTDVLESIGHKHPDSHLLLFADQFEELYTLCHEETEQLSFLYELLLITGQEPHGNRETFPMLNNVHCTLVLTIRTDFLGKAQSNSFFNDALQNALELLAPMNQDELKAAIENPARKLDVEIEQGLTDRILEAISGEPGHLPLLEFALTELWKKQARGTLTHAAYDSIGGVKKALTSHADREFEKLSQEEQERTKRIFTQLVRPGEGTEDTRRVATRADIGEENWDLVTKLADTRLVVTSGNEEDRSANLSLPEADRLRPDIRVHAETVEIVHESLITGWQRLREWIETDREFRTWQERLRAAMRQWETSGHDEGALLRGAPLAEAEHWLEQRRNDLSQDEGHFIESGLEFRDNDIAEREAQRQRELETAKQLAEEQRQRAEEQAKAAQKLRNRFGFAIMFAMIAVLAAIGALYGFRQARLNEENAKAQRDKTLRTQSLFLADLSRQQRKAGFITDAILLALEALPQNIAQPDRPYLFEAQKELYHAVVGPRIRHTLAGHEDEIRHAEFSPNGQYIVTASADTTARIWNAASGEPIAVLKGHNGEVEYAVFSPDGQRVLTTSWDSTARLWNVHSGKALAVLRGHKGEVYQAVFSPDGRRVATLSRDGTAGLWSEASGILLKGQDDEIHYAEFSSDSQRVITASQQTVRVWDVTNGAQLATFAEKEGIVAISPDGRYAATVSADNTTVHVWEIATDMRLTELAGQADPVVFSSDSQRILTAQADGIVNVGDVASGTRLVALKGHESQIDSAAFSPDGQRVATTSFDGTARVWDVTNGAQLAVLNVINMGKVTFSPDGQRLITLLDPLDGISANVWAINSDAQAVVLKGHQGWVNRAEFSPDGQRVVTASTDKTACIWDAASGVQLTTLKGHTHVVVRAEFSPDGQRVVTASWDKTARLWDAASGDQLTILTGHKDEVYHAAFSPDGQRVVTVSRDKTVRLWRAVDGIQLAVLKGHQDLVHHAAFSPDGQHMVTASQDKTARIWDVTNGKQLLVLTGHNGRVFYAAFSPDGQRVVTTSQDRTARIWDAGSGEQLLALEGHQDLVYHAAFSSDGQYVVTVSQDGTARVWDATSGEPLIEFEEDGRIRYADFSPDGQRVVTASLNHIARIWPIFRSSQALIDFARKTIPRHELTPAQRKQFFLE